MKKIRIGSGAGYAGDRIEPAVELMEKGNLDYIIFECLAERTIALGQKDKEQDREKGYNQLLEYRMRRILPLAKEKGIKVITNMGSANPKAAAEKTAALARELGITELKIAWVAGDDITQELSRYREHEILENGKKLKEMEEATVSANVYMGAEGIVEALKTGARIVITGRVSDPALTIGPLVHEFGWTVEKNPNQMGQAVLAGHLLECAGQVIGGYYADPGYKEVPDLYRLGFPLVEIDESGELMVTKVEGSGGLVSTDTCKEQMIYEIHNPKAYMTPDAIADFSQVEFLQVGKDRVKATGATAHGRPETLKVSVGYKDCFIGEGEISYGGSNALARAELAAEVIEKRLDLIGCRPKELRMDLMGWNSLYGDQISRGMRKQPKTAAGSDGMWMPIEIRLRVAGRFYSRREAEVIGNEVEALYTNGPAGGGGAVKRVEEVMSICSIFIPREEVEHQVGYL